MITDNGRYYLYRHVRLDKNEPFYIGIGSKTRADLKKHTYFRAFTKFRRNQFWKNIVSKHQYIIEIILESNNRDFIQQKEKEFIKIYGRRDLGNGTLTNLTDGGDNGLNKSKESIEKQLRTAKFNGSYQRTVDRILKHSFKPGINNGYQDKKTYLYNIYGLFIKEFKTREECAVYVKTFSEEVTKCLRLKRSHKGFIFSNNFLGICANLHGFEIRKDKQKKVQQLDSIKKEIIGTYNSLTEASKSIGVFKTNLSFAIKKGYRCKGFYWEYIN